jgi:hypothetical protein
MDQAARISSDNSYRPRPAHAPPAQDVLARHRDYADAALSRAMSAGCQQIGYSLTAAEGLVLGGTVLARGAANITHQLFGLHTSGWDGGFLAHLHSPWGYDEPEILRYLNRQFGPIGADTGQAAPSTAASTLINAPSGRAISIKPVGEIANAGAGLGSGADNRTSAKSALANSYL